MAKDKFVGKDVQTTEVDCPTVVESVIFTDFEVEKQDSCINERWLEGWKYLDTTLISGCKVIIRFQQ